MILVFILPLSSLASEEEIKNKDVLEDFLKGVKIENNEEIGKDKKSFFPCCNEQKHYESLNTTLTKIEKLMLEAMTIPNDGEDSPFKVVDFLEVLRKFMGRLEEQEKFNEKFKSENFSKNLEDINDRILKIQKDYALMNDNIKNIKNTLEEEKKNSIGTNLKNIKDKVSKIDSIDNNLTNLSNKSLLEKGDFDGKINSLQNDINKLVSKENIEDNTKLNNVNLMSEKIENVTINVDKLEKLLQNVEKKTNKIEELSKQMDVIKKENQNLQDSLKEKNDLIAIYKDFCSDEAVKKEEEDKKEENKDENGNYEQLKEALKKCKDYRDLKNELGNIKHELEKDKEKMKNTIERIKQIVGNKENDSKSDSNNKSYGIKNMFSYLFSTGKGNGQSEESKMDDYEILNALVDRVTQYAEVVSENEKFKEQFDSLKEMQKSMEGMKNLLSQNVSEIKKNNKFFIQESAEKKIYIEKLEETNKEMLKNNEENCIKLENVRQKLSFETEEKKTLVETLQTELDIIKNLNEKLIEDNKGYVSKNSELTKKLEIANANIKGEELMKYHERIAKDRRENLQFVMNSLENQVKIDLDRTKKSGVLNKPCLGFINCEHKINTKEPYNINITQKKDEIDMFIPLFYEANCYSNAYYDEKSKNLAGTMKEPDAALQSAWEKFVSDNNKKSNVLSFFQFLNLYIIITPSKVNKVKKISYLYNEGKSQMIKDKNVSMNFDSIHVVTKFENNNSIKINNLLQLYNMIKTSQSAQKITSLENSYNKVIKKKDLEDRFADSEHVKEIIERDKERRGPEKDITSNRDVYGNNSNSLFLVNFVELDDSYPFYIFVEKYNKGNYGVYLELFMQQTVEEGSGKDKKVSNFKKIGCKFIAPFEGEYGNLASVNSIINEYVKSRAMMLIDPKHSVEVYGIQKFDLKEFNKNNFLINENAERISIKDIFERKYNPYNRRFKEFENNVFNERNPANSMYGIFMEHVDAPDIHHYFIDDKKSTKIDFKSKEDEFYDIVRNLKLLQMAHNDLKPRNFLVEENILKVIDPATLCKEEELKEEEKRCASGTLEYKPLSFLFRNELYKDYNEMIKEDNLIENITKKEYEYLQTTYNDFINGDFFATAEIIQFANNEGYFTPHMAFMNLVKYLALKNDENFYKISEKTNNSTIENVINIFKEFFECTNKTRIILNNILNEINKLEDKNISLKQYEVVKYILAGIILHDMDEGINEKPEDRLFFFPGLSDKYLTFFFNGIVNSYKNTIQICKEDIAKIYDFYKEYLTKFDLKVLGEQEAKIVYQNNFINLKERFPMCEVYSKLQDAGGIYFWNEIISKNELKKDDFEFKKKDLGIKINFDTYKKEKFEVVSKNLKKPYNCLKTPKLISIINMTTMFEKK